MMKWLIILILVGMVVFMSFRVFALNKELLYAAERSAQIEQDNEELRRELMRLGKVNSENKSFLDELEQSVKEFENRMPLVLLEKYIPRKIFNDIKPIIERLQLFQESWRGGDRLQ